MFPSWLFSRIQEYANYLNFLRFIIMSKVLDVLFRDPSSFPPQTYTALGSSKEIPPGLSCGWWVYVEWGWGERIGAGFGVFHLMSPRSPEMLLMMLGICCWMSLCPLATSQMALFWSQTERVGRQKVARGSFVVAARGRAAARGRGRCICVCRGCLGQLFQPLAALVAPFSRIRLRFSDALCPWQPT